MIGAYSMLDGTGLDDWFVGTNNTTRWNPWAGSVAADDAHKGGGYCCQTERSELEGKYYTASNSILDNRWRFEYAAIQRSNDVLRALTKLPEGELTEEEKTELIAESRFLRGVYHFELAKMFRNIPFVDESISFNNQNFKVRNDVESAWPKIEADFQFAIDNLPATQIEAGRGYSWAAKAFLAKVYMQQNKLAEAKPILEDIINNGANVSGKKFGLLPEFPQLWRAAFEGPNDQECVFAAIMSVNDGSDGKNGNEGETSNYPDAFGGWGHQPSFNLVNAYKTQGGYPMFDTFNDVDVTNDMGKELADPFTPYTGTLDPRLDWTVARRGLPFHDYYVQNEHYNQSGGPYRGKKWVPWKQDEGGAGSEFKNGTRFNGNNFRIIRFADILLMAAEVEVEIGDLQKAEDYTNIVRNRAANPAGFLKTYIDNSKPETGFTNTPAANYNILPYGGAAGFVANGKDYARKAVHFERRLELAMEGHRFFDLQRWDLAQPGTMGDLLNAYMQQEVAKWNFYTPTAPYQILQGASFTKGKHEIYAIPQNQIDQSATEAGPTLKQNPGF